MSRIITMSLIFCAFTAQSQNFYNLDFEVEAERGQPRKWFIEEEADQSSVKLTEKEFHSGKRSLEVSVTNGQVVIYLSLPGSMVSGKTLRAEMHMKFSAIDSFQVMLGLKDPAEGKPNIFPVEKSLKDTWILATAGKTFTSYTSDKLMLAVVVVGKGRMFLDDVRVSLDGENLMDEEPEFTEPDKETLGIIRTHAVALSPKDKIDLTAFGNIVGKSRIVGLGENSHGSSSIYKLKLELIKYLVTDKGFTIFALETPIAEADQINDYVMGAEYSRAELLKNLVYPAWKTQEMLDIINWIRSHNLKDGAKVQFRGFDIQGGQSEKTEVARLCKLYHPQLISLVDSIDFQIRDEAALEFQLTLLDKLESNVNSPAGGSPEEQMIRLKRYIHSIRQNVKSKLSRTKVDRDRGMAEMIMFLAQNEKDKIILSGDNSHITKSVGKMGSHLLQASDMDYLAVGFTVGEGTYSAYGPGNPYRIHSPYIGSCEYLFSKTGMSAFALDMRLESLNFLSTSTYSFRSIGSRPQESTQFAEIKLRSHFDAIVYIQKSTHTTFLTE